jgi:hypothetical protein
MIVRRRAGVRSLTWESSDSARLDRAVATLKDLIAELPKDDEQAHKAQQAVKLVGELTDFYRKG